MSAVAAELPVDRTGPVGAGPLVFGSDQEPGIRRRGHRRPRYVDERTGRAVEDPATLERIRALAVPPAWTRVWIAPDPCCHLQATGRDARGRKQYRYHAGFREERERAKFDQLVPFGHALPALRRRLAEDLRLPGLPRRRVIAIVVELLERTSVRVGNEEYARTNGSYGLTTLRDEHVTVDGSQLRIRFTGKSAKLHDVHVRDPRLAALVRRCQDLPGQVLFQYVGDDGAQHPVRSSDVNDYLRAVARLDVTAKTFRTWNATVDAASALAACPPASTRRQAVGELNAVVREVAARLNNTPAVCRRSYVHPAVLDAHLDGTLPERWRRAGAAGSARLTADERRLLRFLASLPPVVTHC